MSRQSAEDFINRVTDDENLRNELQQNPGGTLQIAQKHGFSFSQDDFNAAMDGRENQGGTYNGSFTFSGQCRPGNPGGGNPGGGNPGGGNPGGGNPGGGNPGGGNPGGNDPGNQG